MIILVTGSVATVVRAAELGVVGEVCGRKVEGVGADVVATIETAVAVGIRATMSLKCQHFADCDVSH